MENRLTAVAEQILRLEQRVLTGNLLEQYIWKIWQHCRTNANSLDSERQCRIVRQIVEGAVLGVQQRCEDLAVQLSQSEQMVKELRGELRAVKCK
jgi:hypothetical protein